MNEVILCSFDNYIYANIVLLRLKNEGIECYLKDENTLTIDPLLIPALGGMKLIVDHTDLARAVALLDEIELEYLKTLACPNCGQQSIQRIIKWQQPSNIFSDLLSRLINGSPDSKKITYRCVSCGHKMDSLPTPTENDF